MSTEPTAGERGVNDRTTLGHDPTTATRRPGERPRGPATCGGGRLRAAEERVEHVAVAVVAQQPAGLRRGDPTQLVDLVGRGEVAVLDGHHPVADFLRAA